MRREEEEESWSQQAAKRIVETASDVREIEKRTGRDLHVRTSPTAVRSVDLLSVGYSVDARTDATTMVFPLDR